LKERSYVGCMFGERNEPFIELDVMATLSNAIGVCEKNVVFCEANPSSMHLEIDFTERKQQDMNELLDMKNRLCTDLFEEWTLSPSDVTTDARTR